MSKAIDVIFKDLEDIAIYRYERSITTEKYLELKQKLKQNVLDYFEELLPEEKDTDNATGGTYSTWNGWNACRRAMLDNIKEEKEEDYQDFDDYE